MEAFHEMFGPTLLRKTAGSIESVPTAEALAGKVTLVYFSAHWCGPCRGFTPRLVESYNTIKEAGKNIEVVFVSSDHSPAEFSEYYGEMPWAALPYEDRDRKNAISSKFGIRGIPNLIIFDADGSIISRNGRASIMGDPTGANFPWRPRSVTEILYAGPILGKSGPVTTESLGGKFVGLYFSAHWCPPCQRFTPRLATFYENRKARGLNDFEIVFVSSDKKSEEYAEYYSHMPWLALPFQDSRISELNAKFQIEGIPSLIILSPEGEVITTEAVEGVSSDPTGAKFPYHPVPIVDLRDSASSYGSSINDKPSIVVLMENLDDSDQETIQDVMLPFATSLAKDKRNSPTGPEMLFFVATAPGDISSRIRQMLKLPDVRRAQDPTVALLNLPLGKYHTVTEPEVTPASLGALIDQFQRGLLNMEQLGK